MKSRQIKSKQHVKRIILEKVNIDPDRIEVSQVSNGSILIFFTSDYDKKIHLTKIDTPTYYCIHDEHIEEVVKAIKSKIK